MTRSLTLHNFYPPGRPESGLLERFAARATELGAGAVGVVHGGGLGHDDSAALEWAGRWDGNGGQTGQGGLALIWSVFMRARSAELDAAYIMGSARDLEEHQRALPHLERFLADMLDEAGIVPVAFWPSPVLTISVFARERPVTRLDDLHGRRLRVFSRDLEPTFGRLGIDARFIPQSELHDALARGAFDATVYPACHTAWSVPLWRVTQHASYLFPEALPPYVLACPRPLWEALDDTARDALREAGRAVWPDFLRLSVDPTDEQAARRNLVAAGLTWHSDHSPEDRWRFTRSARETWAEMTAAASPRTQALQQTLLAAMAP